MQVEVKGLHVQFHDDVEITINSRYAVEYAPEINGYGSNLKTS